MFYLVIAFLVISSVQTEAVKVILRHPNNNNNDAGNNTRIIGGRAITIKEAPWQVAILYENELTCGGSVLTKQHVLTAAHCVRGLKARDFKIRAGSSYSNRGGQVRRVSKIAIDGSYNPTTSNNDIAIMKLSASLPINQFITPVKIATDYCSPSGFASTSGWGLTRELGQKTSPVLREVTVQFITLSKCQADYKKRNIIITKNMVCAGSTNGGKDACQGDSGGPLVDGDKQYGVVSMGIGCGRPNFPGVYTSLERKQQWIRKALKVI